MKKYLKLASEAPAPYGNFHLIRNYDGVPIGFPRELLLPTSAVKHGFCCRANRFDRGPIDPSRAKELFSSKVKGWCGKALKFNIYDRVLPYPENLNLSLILQR